MTVDGKSVGLALSGGGYRATLFGLGSLWRLNDTGLLGKLDRITSVSGGSIVAGVLAHRWSKLTWDDGRATNFVQEIAEPVQAFCDKTIDIGAGLLGLITPFKTAGDFLADRYAKSPVRQDQDEGASRREVARQSQVHLLRDEPADRAELPLPAGHAGRLHARHVECDRRAARFRGGRLERLPPGLLAHRARGRPGLLEEGSNLPNLNALRKTIVLTDGGVYDNMGLESLVDNEDIVLVSDAGAPMDIEEDPHGDYPRQLARVRDILIEQTRALRKRWLIAEFEAERKRGAYWGIGTSIESYADTTSPFKDTTVTNALVSVPTRLARFEDETQGRLVNWGYVLCDVALRRRAKLAIPTATKLPLPQWSL